LIKNGTIWQKYFLDNYMKKKIQEILQESSAVKNQVSLQCAADIEKAIEIIIGALKKGGKLILCGNGGSAADAQHIAAELVGRFKEERKALAAIALTTDTSILTAIGNDYGYKYVFKRQVEALANKGDILLAISTSGNAPNVIEVVELANKIGLKTIALTGGSGGKLAKAATLSIIVPSVKTPRIQESHIAIGHIICELVEETLKNA